MVGCGNGGTKVDTSEAGGGGPAPSDPVDTAASENDETGSPPAQDTAPPTDAGDDPAAGPTDGGAEEERSTDDSSGMEEEGVPATPAPDYALPGPWHAGVLTKSFTSPAAIEHWVDVWYPARDTGSGPVEYYGSPMWVVDGEGYRDATPDCTEPRPVMVHSHGSSSTRWELFPLTEFMATHGWLVVAPDHTGNTYYSTGTPWRTLLERRPRDIQYTFDWLVRQSNDPVNPLFGCVDESDGYVVSGYSFGGYTAYAVGGAQVNDIWGEPHEGLADTRVTQVVTHAAWDGYRALADGTKDITVPVLTIGGERDGTVGTAYMELHSHIRSPTRALASFPDAGHYTPVPHYCEVLWPGDGCGSMYMDPSVYLSITKTSVLAFLEHNRGRTGAWEQIVAHPSVEWDTIRGSP